VSQIVVRPNGPLEGAISIGGAKISALKLVTASLPAEGEYDLRNVPPQRARHRRRARDVPHERRDTG
jgi:UDP-N-acetylglucosamine enolpyruvyl transferase